MNPRMPSKLLAAAMAAGIALPTTLLAQSAEEKGLQIAQEADRRDEGFGDHEQTLVMILRNRHGQETTREIRGKSLEVADDGDKSMVIFDSPKDVEGTALLTHSHKSGDDDQWLYLPALKRVKRIASNNKAELFTTIKMADGSGTVVERMEIAHEESIFAYTITANDALPMENYCATVMLSDTGDGGTNVSYGSNWDPKGIEEDEMRTMLEDLYGAILDAIAKG